MKIDNFSLMEKLFPCKEDEFYFLQVIVRGKDNDMNKNRMVKFYTIRSFEHLLQVKDEVIALCRVNNARAYMHPTKRNVKEVANLVLELTAHAFVSQQWSGLKSVYSTACGKSYVNGDKKFIVDLDDIEIGSESFKEIESFIAKLRGRGGEGASKTFMAVPTVHGCHLITYPFDLGEFGRIFPGIDVHKNNPTLVYYEWQSKEKRIINPTLAYYEF